MVLLVVDTQKGIVDERLYVFKKFVDNIKSLIHTAREQGIEVIFVQHDDGPGTGFSIGDDEFEVYSEFQPLPTEKRFVKTVCSAFREESGLMEHLTAKGEKDVMVCGIMTDFCINATVEAGFEHGLHMIVPAYANSTQGNEYMTGEQSYHYYNEFLWPERYADCVSIDEALGLLKNSTVKMENSDIERDGWTPVSEGKPKKPGHYLVTRCSPTRTTMLFYEDRKWWNDPLHTDEWPNDLIVAWKPLPKPYKGK